MEKDKLKKFVFRFLDKQYGDVVKNDKSNQFGFDLYSKPGSEVALFSTFGDDEIILKYSAKVREDIMDLFSVSFFDAQDFLIEWIKTRFSIDPKTVDPTYSTSDGSPSVFLLP